MKRFLVLSLGALLVAAAAGAPAQGLSSVEGRGRDEGRGQERSQPAYDGGGGQHYDGGRGLTERGGARGQGHAGREQDWGGGQQPVQPHTQGYGFGQQPGYGGVQPQYQPRQDWGRQESRDQRQQWSGDRRWNDRGLPDVNQQYYGQQRYDRRDHDRYDRRDRDWNRYDRHDRGWRDSGWRRSWNHGWNGHRYRAPSRYYWPRGYSYSSRSWYVGFRLPSAFYGRSYYVDYRPYGLAPPPWGCQWIRIDGDVLLVEIATGEIVDILYGFYY